MQPSASLKQHLRDICFICEKKFTTAHSLKLHKLSHDVARPIKCDLCLKSFNCLANMKRHKNCAHKPVFQCVAEGCDKTFMLEAEMTAHQLVDHPPTDDMADKSGIPDIGALPKLLLTRTGCRIVRNKRYKCPSCAYRSDGRLVMLKHCKNKHGMRQFPNLCAV